jgi:hypothetical protein
VKVLVSFGNAALSGASAASGGLKLVAASGLTVTGVGTAPGLGMFAWSAWNMNSSMAAWQRSRQQWNEAFNENWCDANWKNWYGLFPFGTHYDDPNEAGGPLDFIRKRGLWTFMSEAGLL